MSLEPLWHDLECGSYAEDLSLWRELVAEHGGPVLDIGAGTGRVALDLARSGVEVVAVDSDAELLAVLAGRAAAERLPVTTVVADARALALGRRFPLVLVPMQTLQLLGGAAGRAAFLRGAHAHLEPGGVLACALAQALDSFDGEVDGLPTPDLAVIGGVRYTSLPLAVIDEGDRAAIHRLREVVHPDGSRTEADDVIRLDRTDADEVTAEAVALGFTPGPHRHVPATEEHVGSEVVILHA